MTVRYARLPWTGRWPGAMFTSVASMAGSRHAPGQPALPRPRDARDGAR